MANNGNGRNGQAAGILTGLLIGGVVGASIALLEAPQSGKDTREQIQKEATAMWNMAGDSVATVRSRVEGAAKQVSGRVATVQSRSRGALKRSRKHLNKAIAEAKRAAEAAAEAR